MPQYLIKPGRRFRMPDGKVEEAGAVIELSEDVAAMHSVAVDLVPQPDADAATDAAPAADAQAIDTDAS